MLGVTAMHVAYYLNYTINSGSIGYIIMPTPTFAWSPANNDVATKVALAIAAMPHKRTVVKPSTFVPCFCSYIVDPSGVA